MRLLKQLRNSNTNIQKNSLLFSLFFPPLPQQSVIPDHVHLIVEKPEKRLEGRNLKFTDDQL